MKGGYYNIMINKLDIFIYLEMLFKKSMHNITKEELLNVSTIVIEYKEFDNLGDQIELSQVLHLLPNLKKVTIKNKHITANILADLSLVDLESLSFENCSISNDFTLKTFENLKELFITNCALLDYSILDTINKKIKKIAIINPIDEKIIDISHFLNYLELNELFLERCVVENIDKVSNLSNLKVISLLWSDIVDIHNISVFLNLRELEDVYLSKYYEDLEEVRNLSSQKNVYYDLKHLVFGDNKKNL